MEVPEHIAEGLRNIREGIHLRWNPKAVLVKKGDIDASGKVRDPGYDPRFELWDTDPEGGEYIIMRLQNIDGSFRPPGEWLLDVVRKTNPERFDGDVDKLIKAMVEEPELFREIGTQRDSDDFINDTVKRITYHSTPMSGRGIRSRGKRILSA
jgi:hypothetical protein